MPLLLVSFNLLSSGALPEFFKYLCFLFAAFFVEARNNIFFTS